MSLIPSGGRIGRPSFQDWRRVANSAQDAYRQYRRWSEANQQREDDNPRPTRRQRVEVSMPPLVPTNIKQYTKRLINRKIETKKRAIQINDVTMNYVTWYYTAPLQFIAVGTGKNQRISDKISDVYLRYNICFLHLNNTQWEATWLRILIIASDKELPVDVATPAYAVTPGNGGNFNFLLSNDFHQSFGVVDRNDYTVLYDRSVRSVRQNTAITTGTPVIHKIRKKLASEAVYQENTTGGVQFQKKKNIYLLFGISNRGATVGDIGGALQSSGFVYFKDG